MYEYTQKLLLDTIHFPNDYEFYHLKQKTKKEFEWAFAI